MSLLSGRDLGASDRDTALGLICDALEELGLSEEAKAVSLSASAPFSRAPSAVVALRRALRSGMWDEVDDWLALAQRETAPMLPIASLILLRFLVARQRVLESVLGGEDPLEAVQRIVLPLEEVFPTEQSREGVDSDEWDEEREELKAEGCECDCGEQVVGREVARLAQGWCPWLHVGKGCHLHVPLLECLPPDCISSLVSEALCVARDEKCPEGWCSGEEMGRLGLRVFEEAMVDVGTSEGSGGFVGRCINVLVGASCDISSVCASVGAALIAGGGSKGEVMVWKRSSGEMLGSVQVHSGEVRSLAWGQPLRVNIASFSPTSSTSSEGAGGGEGGGEEEKSEVDVVAPLVSGGVDGSVWIWDGMRLKVICPLLLPHSRAIDRIEDGLEKEWREVKQADDECVGVGFLWWRNPQWVGAVDRGGKLRVFDLKSLWRGEGLVGKHGGEGTGVVVWESVERIRQAQFVGDGDIFLLTAGNKAYHIHISPPSTSVTSSHLPTASVHIVFDNPSALHEHRVGGIAGIVSSGERSEEGGWGRGEEAAVFCATLHGDPVVIKRDQHTILHAPSRVTGTFELIPALSKLPSPTTTLRYTPPLYLAATGAEDGTIWVWTVDQSMISSDPSPTLSHSHKIPPNAKKLKGHLGAVNCVQIIHVHSPTPHTYILSASDDRSIRIWE